MRQRAEQKGKASESAPTSPPQLGHLSGLDEPADELG